MKKFTQLSICILLSSVMLYGCKSWSNAQKGAAIGTASGGVVGAAIGRASGNTALGAVIGATVGGASGIIIGRQMDKQAAEMAKEIPNATVERVGEGIVMEMNDKVLFAINKYELGSRAKRSLNNFVDILEKYPDTNIEIQGHTDNTGTDSYNQTLSENRASAVSSYLRTQGVSGSRLSVRGFGESAPKYSNETEETRALNRNVQFLITANSKMKADAKAQAK